MFLETASEVFVFGWNQRMVFHKFRCSLNHYFRLDSSYSNIWSSRSGGCISKKFYVLYTSVGKLLINLRPNDCENVVFSFT